MIRAASYYNQENLVAEIDRATATDGIIRAFGDVALRWSAVADVLSEALRDHASGMTGAERDEASRTICNIWCSVVPFRSSVGRGDEVIDRAIARIDRALSYSEEER